MRYSRDALQQMAKHAIAAAGPLRDELVLRLCDRMGLTPRKVEWAIVRLAWGMPL